MPYKRDNQILPLYSRSCGSKARLKCSPKSIKKQKILWCGWNQTSANNALTKNKAEHIHGEEQTANTMPGINRFDAGCKFGVSCSKFWMKLKGFWNSSQSLWNLMKNYCHESMSLIGREHAPKDFSWKSCLMVLCPKIIRVFYWSKTNFQNFSISKFYTFLRHRLCFPFKADFTWITYVSCAWNLNEVLVPEVDGLQRFHLEFFTFSRFDKQNVCILDGFPLFSHLNLKCQRGM